LSPLARADVDGIWDYIAERSSAETAVAVPDLKEGARVLDP
jgi:plasmid stabilization system protein ParE